jgi:endonuclease/exonuclease/phosphatase (EEP) superfamily protein YafD
MLQMRNLLRLSVYLLVAALVAETAISYLGRFHWLPELLTHFRVQGAIAALGVLLVAAALRLPRAAALAAVCAAAQAGPVLPYVMPRAAPPPLEAVPIRILLLNVLTANDHFSDVAALIALEDPDVVALLEVDERWVDALAPLRARYPEHASRPQSDNFGIAVWSRVPIAELAFRRLEHDAVYAATGELAIEGEPAVLLVAHPVPPVGGIYTALRDRQLDALARIRHEFPSREAIVLGDLNAAPWSPSHLRFESQAGLSNAARGLGWFPSWPTNLPWLRVPIDHCLLSPGLRAVSVRVGRNVGSDHFPVIVEVARAKPAAL